MMGGLVWLLLRQAKLYRGFILALYGIWLIFPFSIALIIFGRSPTFDIALAPYAIILSVISYFAYVGLYFTLLIHRPVSYGDLDKSVDRKAKSDAAKATDYIK